VSLLVSGVFWDEVEVFSADDESSVHLGGNNSSGEDTAANGDETGERALLVDVAAFNRILWCAESQSNVLVPSSSSLADSGGLGLRLGVEEDMGLLLESPLGLNGQFGRHDFLWLLSQEGELG